MTEETMQFVNLKCIYRYQIGNTNIYFYTRIIVSTFMKFNNFYSNTTHDIIWIIIRNLSFQTIFHFSDNWTIWWSVNFLLSSEKCTSMSSKVRPSVSGRIKYITNKLNTKRNKKTNKNIKQSKKIKLELFINNYPATPKQK